MRRIRTSRIPAAPARRRSERIEITAPRIFPVRLEAPRPPTRDGAPGWPAGRSLTSRRNSRQRSPRRGECAPTGARRRWNIYGLPEQFDAPCRIHRRPTTIERWPGAGAVFSAARIRCRDQKVPTRPISTSPSRVTRGLDARRRADWPKVTAAAAAGLLHAEHGSFDHRGRVAPATTTAPGWPSYRACTWDRPLCPPWFRHDPVN